MIPAEFSWRPAAPTDDESILEMFRELYREDPGIEPVADEQLRRTLGVFRKQPLRGCAVVLEIEGRARGYALLASFWSNELGGDVCTIDELYVRRESRGRGHARALIALLRGRNPLWDRPSVALSLEVTPDNARARDLYVKLGFKPVRNATLRLKLP